MRIEEIISELKGYEKRITELELKNHVLRKENEKLKKELNIPIAPAEEDLDGIGGFTPSQIADIIDKEESPEIMINCLTILLNEDKHNGQKISPIIAKIINNPYLPEEGIKMIFSDIETNAGRNRISDKYEGRLRCLLKSPKLPKNLADKIVKFYVKKSLQRHSNTRYAITRLRNFAKSTPKYVEEKINEIIGME